ncbi:DNA-3-methyladenine glycosylase [Rufibacter glacialis]|uniref:Putative 3-methyladenine DNA glycosylase n=1 Tax=Rufibacter glacialis TaxID=1259555 RepID=A0A5M8QQF1_9BACT|nr:DNA-3-methyladenine glycosylase [Rufibacter glacialis]KAA6437270.1 DNA-3-methyladenine glycosylase [Rufibacter glacialis]GGK60535.1 putative 3-methyladenine DNA glycosylase [Rufibacter glacialis]
MPFPQKLPAAFYTRPDVVTIARDLIGKSFYTCFDGVLTGGMVVETEAYSGLNDAACHAHLGRRTKRTQIMYEPGGVAYVYLIYGIYSLFNIVTNVAGTADAVLIRAIEPTEGIEEMQLRRGLSKVEPRLTAGPGLVTQALGISTRHNGIDLSGNEIWFEDRGVQVPEDQIVAGLRVGVAYAGADALLPWRFSLKGSRWVSKAKPKY